jgi:hypothetical protein
MMTLVVKWTPTALIIAVIPWAVSSSPAIGPEATSRFPIGTSTHFHSLQATQHDLFLSSFMGGNAFCFRICDPSRPNARNFCENVYDRIGCAYNDPNNAKEGVFEVCAADNADYVGIYTDSKGAVQTYHQPDEALGPITTIPYTPRIPGSSNCVTYTSSALYTDLATVSPTVSVTPSGSLSTSRKLGVSSTGSGAGVKPTNPGSISNDASVLAISGISFLAVVFSALFLA